MRGFGFWKSSIVKCTARVEACASSLSLFLRVVRTDFQANQSATPAPPTMGCALPGFGESPLKVRADAAESKFGRIVPIRP